MDLKQLRLFLAVAEERNFTRAAERVNLSQPALSHRIHQLEDDLGVLLFERTARGAKLTLAGESLVEDARHLLERAELSVRRARRAGGMTDDRLRVGFDFVEFGGVPPMPSLLNAFRTRFPEASVNIETLAVDDLERAVLEERFDIAFQIGPPSRPELGFHALLKGSYRVLLPATHPLAGQEPITLTELLAERLLLPRLGARDDAILMRYLETSGHAPKVVYKGAEVAAFAGLLAAGEGVAVLPSGLLREVGVGLVMRGFEDAPVWSFGLSWRKEKPPFLADLGQKLIRQIVPEAVLI